MVDIWAEWHIIGMPKDSIGGIRIHMQEGEEYSMWLGVLLAFGCLLVPLAETFVPWFTKPFRDRDDELIQRGRQPRKTTRPVTSEETLREHMSWIHGTDQTGGKDDGGEGGNGKCS